jgi:hypothetical protein
MKQPIHAIRSTHRTIVAEVMLFALAFALVLVGSVRGADALVLDSGDGRGNTDAPPGLPEWANVGRRWGGPSVVYVGNRWVLTANHVGAGIVVFDDERYDAVAGTPRQILNPDGSPADLLIFRIDRDPGLPALRIALRPPRIGQEVFLIGTGASRGRPLTVDSPIAGLLDGFHWSPDETRRWGTNTTSGAVETVIASDSRTLAIPMVFDRIDDPGGTDHEAAAAHGDSGGALFALEDALMPERGHVLSGILFSVSSTGEQPNEASLYGNVSYAVDLSSYRDQLIAVIHPACSNERDDDLDERIDYPEDPDCGSSNDDDEATTRADGRPLGRWLSGLVLALLVWRLTALWRARSA